MTASNRRDFLRVLGRRAAQDARSVAQVALPLVEAASPANMMRSALAEPEVAPGPPAAVGGITAEPPVVEELTAPAAPERCADPDALIALIDAEGLGAHRAALLALARRSVRLVPGAAPASADAWVDLAAADALSAPVPADAEPATAMLMQLAGPARALSGTPFAGPGWTVLFARPTGPGTIALQATVLEEPAALGPGMEPVALAAHLALPRVWTTTVQALGLDADERAAYVRVRDGLTVAQGLDVEPGAARTRAYHRLLGYPDETSGAMPGRCAETAGDGDWQLLAQLTVGPARRVYAWAADGDLGRLAGFSA